ncbi:MAG: ArsR/SmtB family transcription factor [Phycisphaerales bacterium]
MSRTALSDSQFQAISRALADPRRFSILEKIAAHRELACMCLVAEVPITQATLSHHVKELAAAGLVSCRKEGKCGHFRVNRGVLSAYQAELRRRLALSGAARRTAARSSSAAV